jgi:small-conductance mechanosensitive channel
MELRQVLLFALAVGGLGVLLHWIIGRIKRVLLHRMETAPATTHPVAGQPVKQLLIEWGSKGMRTLLWLLIAVFLLHLLPQTRPRLLTMADHLEQTFNDFAAWLGTRGVVAIVVIVATVFLMRFAATFIGIGFELLEQRAPKNGAARLKRRSQTLSLIFRGLTQVLILFIGLMVFLEQLGINITPILASLGIVGIAIGFGAQSLVKDIFAGLMILLEDQFGVGDVVKIGDTSGVVEHLSLRSTRVRSFDGSLTTIPNGSISAASNLSKDWSRAVLDVEIDYREDIDRAMRVMIETAQQLKQERPQHILEEPVVLGLEALTKTSLVLRLAVKTAPAKQTEIGRELRRRIKLAFDSEGIKVPSG